MDGSDVNIYFWELLMGWSSYAEYKVGLTSTDNECICWWFIARLQPSLRTVCQQNLRFIYAQMVQQPWTAGSHYASESKTCPAYIVISDPVHWLTRCALSHKSWNVGNPSLIDECFSPTLKNEICEKYSLQSFFQEFQYFINFNDSNNLYCATFIDFF